MVIVIAAERKTESRCVAMAEAVFSRALCVHQSLLLFKHDMYLLHHYKVTDKC